MKLRRAWSDKSLPRCPQGGLTETGADTLADGRTGKNGRHRLAGLLRQSVFGQLARLTVENSYEGVV